MNHIIMSFTSSVPVRLRDQHPETGSIPGSSTGKMQVRATNLDLGALDGHQLDGPAAEAADLLALVAGQDVEAGEDGVFRIARKVARDRLISTVDVEARHGHKSRARTFDGYKSHFGVDPDDELITNVAVTAANTADREVLDELLDQPGTAKPAAATEPAADEPAVDTGEPAANTGEDSESGSRGGCEPKHLEVYGDSAYADGATLDEQTAHGHDMRAKVPPERNANGFSKDQFSIDLAAGTVTCPAQHTVAIRSGRHRSARFGALCQSCPLRAACTKARRARVISIHPHEAALQPPKPANGSGLAAGLPDLSPRRGTQVSHFTRRPWGGRKARCRGQKRILTDILTRASALNLARLAPWACTTDPPAGPSPDPEPPATSCPGGQLSDAVRGIKIRMPSTTNPTERHCISGVLEVDQRSRFSQCSPAGGLVISLPR